MSPDPLSPTHARPTARGVAAALFASRTQAQGAIQDLRSAGFDPARIGLALRDRDAQDQLVAEAGTQAGGGAGVGAAGGGVIGGLAGLLIGLGALIIPGIGPVVAGGVLASALGIAGGTALAGAGLGAATGGLLGALVGAGLPEVEARRLHEGFAAGGVLVTVEAGEGRLGAAEGILENAGGDLGRGGAAPLTTTTAGHDATAPAAPAPTADFIGTRRLTDDDTGSKMTMA